MNKVYLEIYNPTKTYILPSLVQATPQKLQEDYPVLTVMECVITTDVTKNFFYAIDTFLGMCDRHNINPEDYATKEETISALEAELSKEPVVDNTPTAEERIASALEYQNALAE